METKSVIVTMYFNLRKLKDVSKGTRPPEFYMTAGKGTLQMDYPMVIFCDNDTYPFIKTIRDELIGINDKTIYIIKPLEEYEFYKMNWPIINNFRKRGTRNPEDRNTTSYYLICMFKTIALKLAHTRNDFDGSHYIWMDFGCSHIVYNRTLKDDAIRMIEFPRSKITVMYIRFWTKNDQKNIYNTIESGQCGIAGTVFTVESNYIDRFYSSMMALFYDVLSQEKGHTDEQIMTYCFYKWPNLFNIYYGDYYSVISNYHHVRNDWHLIKYALINPAITDGSKILAKGAINAILDGYEAGVLSIHHSEITELRNQLELLSQ